MERKEIIIRCLCDCTFLRITFDNIDNAFTISAYEDAFIAKQNKVKRYFERLWSAITGREYFLFELILDEDEYYKMMEFFVQTSGEHQCQ